MAFSLGDRVRISHNYYKARGALGTVAMPPEYVLEMMGDTNYTWEGHRRFVQFPSCLIEYYWIEFDVPQQDDDYDDDEDKGRSFTAAEIEAYALEPIQGDTDC